MRAPLIVRLGFLAALGSAALALPAAAQSPVWLLQQQHVWRVERDQREALDRQEDRRHQALVQELSRPMDRATEAQAVPHAERVPSCVLPSCQWFAPLLDR